jgi:prepilin-type N-terminal cleavage/methylation domain-containing protein
MKALYQRPMSSNEGAERGVTIIELMIVLAMAGLIMMLVLMAIPALQRNAHNNNRRQDVATVLEAVSHYQLNNSGNMPPAHPTTADGFFLSKLYSYDATDTAMLTITAQAPGFTSPKAANTNPDTIKVYNHEVCLPTGDATDRGAGYDNIVALYAIEKPNGFAGQCQQL